MDENKKHDIALMRYTAISSLISGSKDDYGSMSAYYRDVAAKGVKAPDGNIRFYSPSTIEKWYLLFKKGGFDALIPSGRSDRGVSRRIDEELSAEINRLKHSYPRLSAAAIYRQLCDEGKIRPDQISEATICRFINQLMLQEKFSNNTDMRRYERPHINEVWCGDSSFGPYLKTDDGKKHRIFIIALIDDASRLVTGADVFLSDTFVNLMSVIKSAVAKYGRPKLFNFDNGASYRNRQMELLAARIGTVINYCRPYTPTQKAKIERWFRTMKDQWMAKLDMNEFHTLAEVRGSLRSYIQEYNQREHSSLNGKSPQERFFSEGDSIVRLDEEKINKVFLLEISRSVTADCVISIDKVEYEVDYRFAGRRITIRYTPDMSEVYVVEADETLTPIHLLNKHENAVIKREKVSLSGGDD